MRCAGRQPCRLTDGRRLPFWEPPTPALAGGRIPGLFVSSGLPLLADSQSILQGGRHFESFNRLLNSVLLIGCLNNSEMFSPSADYIDAPAGHSHINAHKKRAIVTMPKLYRDYLSVHDGSPLG